MLPNIYDIAGVPVSLHDSIVGLGMLVGGLLLYFESRRRELLEDDWWWALLGALVGSVIGARLGPWFQSLDFRHNLSLWDQWQYGNRSILGGLAGAWLGVLIVKRITGWKTTTGDAWAPAVALGMAIGRVGCFLTEIPGTPTGGDWGIVLGPRTHEWLPGAPVGVPLHPSFAYEIVFHLAAFASLWSLRNRPYPPGTLFRWYVAAYGVFRFAVEFVRGNEQEWLGLTRPQWFIAAMFVVGIAWRLVRRWRARRAVAAASSSPSDVSRATV